MIVVDSSIQVPLDGADDCLVTSSIARAPNLSRRYSRIIPGVARGSAKFCSGGARSIPGPAVRGLMYFSDLDSVSTVHQQQRKHLLAAHREIHKMGEEAIAAASLDAEGASMEGEATEHPPHHHRMSFRKSSVPDPTTTSTDDSSLENMFLAIEEHHRSK